MARLLSLFLLLLCSVPAAAAGLSNQLADHPSPYLAMHAADPVAWQLWGPEVVRRAKRENRLIFISSGYFSCRWCHVMHRESYQDAAVAGLLNNYFIPVKVDRELEPALDAQLIEFVELTQGRAGWPLNVFLTPDGYPLLGFTYLPRDRFHALLSELQQRWSAERERLSQMARQGVEELRALKTQVGSSGAAVKDAGQAMLSASAPLRDEMSGGFGQETKFPMVSQLWVLLDLYHAGYGASLKDFLQLTLDQMASQGLRDHLGGGFFRYSTDPGWQAPHFEKMLYDNAQLTALYLKAARILKRADYRATALETLDFILDNMDAGNGAYIGSFSAVDTEGREGHYYLWSDEALNRLLDSDERRVARAYWRLQGPSPFDDGYLPKRGPDDAAVARELGLSPEVFQALLQRARAKLLQARAQRKLPVDAKQLAAWNGLLLSTLAQAYAEEKNPRYRRAGERLAAYLSRVLWDGRRLSRARAGGRPLGNAGVADYALVARGLQDWAERVSDEPRQRTVAALVKAGWRLFYRDGRWFQSENSPLATLGGKLALESSPLPSASAVLTGLALNHPLLKQDKALQQQAATHLDSVRRQLMPAIFWYADYVPLLRPAQALR